MSVFVAIVVIGGMLLLAYGLASANKGSVQPRPDRFNREFTVKAPPGVVYAALVKELKYDTSRNKRLSFVGTSESFRCVVVNRAPSLIGGWGEILSVWVDRAGDESSRVGIVGCSRLGIALGANKRSLHNQIVGFTDGCQAICAKAAHDYKQASGS